MSDRVDLRAFREVFNALDVKTQDEIKNKANWEQMSLPAVVRAWWPDIWARIELATKAAS